MESKGEIVIYRSPEGETELSVNLKEDTVWLTPTQMTKLFEKARPTILEHIKNIYEEAELDSTSTCRKFRQVQIEGNRSIIRNIDHYNLDVIISVGYRVKSKRGTQFRIWANKILKEYLVKGYSLNEKRLKEQSEKVKELEKSIEVFKRVADSFQLKQDEFTGILKVISDYTYALDILDQYDHQKLKLGRIERKEEYKISYKDSAKLITNLKNKFGGSGLFGKEKNESFRSTIGTIYQTFNKKELYPSLEEKAAMLLYLTIKNHSFIDGNKRIGAALFLMYLSKNSFLYGTSGEKRIADNALVALCLMIAASNPKEKDIIVKVVVNLINKNN
ncbi:MAG: cytochrome C biogenesis protein CycH [Ignavibacteria bacterium RIFOXYB2_FULL_35_12]|nr:MAG: cytochrome C biogenesis protein CycH [Ignavibacteria bacterium GWA2_36_19]OGU59830.1 MAG: cytochrome C biogenesis protein CycH [Ignavibacteria bacterium GWF2_35_20]OGU83065.1 MAG: cytochrome C biogenesis protein CycH [Ignavibacteria bacterium RIFOXYA2_FULL_35_9]OGU89994.1 MAG: cytochrome C biogenesis protein CycH [Ignavibacteria bacterium RIFOXYC12_FULL_35_11]OGU91140.1 MAG: cytochrome C biogenesis protein CycH [Ignavibacteria bacterium RIFOXYA12_FULL_35_25]OGU96998.1 MAG: cytochrome C